MNNWLLCLVVWVALTGCTPAIKQVHLGGSTMGTTYNIKYLAQDGVANADTIEQGIVQQLDMVNQHMSTYRDDSEISRFNQLTTTEPVAISAAMHQVMAEALRLSQITDGALDITVGPLVNLWGFGPKARRERIPTATQLAQQRARVGIKHLHLNGLTLRKELPELYLDASSLAKGWGVDVVADYLDSQHITNYMVEIGGEIRLRGHNASGSGWRIAIEKPTADARSTQEIITPGNMAIATSGDYRNYFEHDGVRYSHIINPGTGKPVTNRVVSVTVLDKSSMTADGLATGLMVLGEERALQVAEQHKLAVFMIIKTDQGFKEVVSSAFAPYLKQ